MRAVACKRLELEARVPLFEPQDRPDAAPPTPPQIGLDGLEHIETVSTGVDDVYGPVYDDLGLNKGLPPVRYRAAHRILFETVMARLGQPLSQRATAAYVAAEWGASTSLDAIDRLMDRFDETRIEKACERIAASTRELFPPQLRALFFDGTTLYFASVREADEDDGFMQWGSSKDGKANRVQIVLAVVVDEQGLRVT